MRKKKITPLFYRDPRGHMFSWEIYSLTHWFLTFSIGSVEVQFNKWPKNWVQKG